MDHVYRKDRAVVSPQTIQKFCQEIANAIVGDQELQELFRDQSSKLLKQSLKTPDLR